MATLSDTQMQTLTRASVSPSADNFRAVEAELRNAPAVPYLL
ncbi:hypothetical protein ABH939_005901 [Rhodococcus sp. 27YEA6]